MRVLLFAYSGNNKSYYSAKHNHKLEQVRICDHWHQLLPFASPALTQPPFGSPVKSIILFQTVYHNLMTDKSIARDSRIASFFGSDQIQRCDEVMHPFILETFQTS